MLSIVFYALLLNLYFRILVTAQWKRLPISNDEPPPPRAYHTMTSIGARHLLIGGFDGKSTFGDLWWLVPEGIFLLFYTDVLVQLSYHSVYTHHQLLIVGNSLDELILVLVADCRQF